MSMSEHETALVDIHHFLQTQFKERFRAFVIHAPPRTGKTRLACRLAETVTGGVYLDFLTYAIEHPELVQRIDTLDVANVQKIIINYASEKKAKLLLVDELDFLIHTWEPDLTSFKHMVKSLSESQTPTTIGFFVQTNHALEAWSLLNGVRQNRILPIETIQRPSASRP
jgi:ATPase family associated with various cellular activities (AAA)